jgi:kumamolisin
VPASPRAFQGFESSRPADARRRVENQGQRLVRFGERRVAAHPDELFAPHQPAAILPRPTEIAGAIAPKARMRVYFAPPETGFVDAVKQATADRVSVLSIGWGGPETAWKDADISKMDNALAEAANQHMTVVVSTGGQGVTDGVSDKHRHVDFPSSSPWVLSVGGTSIRVEAGRIKAEAVWKKQDVGFASGGGASEKFSRPDWQSAVAIPAREAGGLGRGIPDVVAFVDATLGYGIRVHGKTEVVGGTGAAAPLWAGLVALINQGLGHNIGYFNPRLYREIGPAGVLSAITEGDNSVGGVEGFKAGPGWTPVAGWGRPDGMKLLNWLRMYPDAQRPDASVNTACATQSQ